MSVLAGTAPRAHAAAPVAERSGPDGEWPWTRSDVVRSGIWTLVGLVVLVVCCVGISRAKTYDDQLVWVAVGAVALAVALFGGVRWILRGMRVVRGTRRDVLTELARVTADEPAVAEVDSRSVHFTPAMSRFHTAACPFARGKDLAAVSRSEVGERRPCEVCEP